MKMSVAVLLVIALACAGVAMAGPDLMMNVYNSDNCTSVNRQLNIQQKCYAINGISTTAQTNCNLVRSCVNLLPLPSTPELLFKCFLVSGPGSGSLFFNTDVMNLMSVALYVTGDCSSGLLSNFTVPYSTTCATSFDSFGLPGCLSALQVIPPVSTTSSGSVSGSGSGSTTTGSTGTPSGSNSGSPAAVLVADLMAFAF